MEFQSGAAARRLWNVVRITFLMMRKGLISKRKLIMDMNLMMKKGKLVRKSLSNLMSHHHHHSSRSVTRGGFGIQEYEFSCSNSPVGPVLFHKRKHHHFNFPCINHPEVREEEEEDHLDLYEQQQKPTNNNNNNMMVLNNNNNNNNNHVVCIPRTPEYSLNLKVDACDFGAGEKKSPMRSSFSVRISNYSALDETETDQEGVNAHVDAQAEDFIRTFYEQLRMQSRMQLLTTLPS